MRIQRVLVDNFRAIRNVEITDLGHMVMIAGPNGCGKSCLLDAIRLLKSLYGGYQAGEWQQWFGEFQINLRSRAEVVAILRDKSRPARLSMSIELADTEREYLRLNGRELVEALVWRTLIPGLNDPWIAARGALAGELRAHQEEVQSQTEAAWQPFLRRLDAPSQVAELVIQPGGAASTEDNLVLEVLFSSYQPQHIGVIDYHGPTRNYAREQFGGINLNLEESEDKLRQHALYNYGNKYTNIKSEMAGEYVRSLLATEAAAGTATVQHESLIDTLKELFATFFPGKTFLGPKATSGGGVTFPVRLSSGITHDINDLSSGEKEVLFGYLRLRNTAPRNSVILLDEPELHLNPALVRGLPQFYDRHLGRALNNQLWLVTHSDAFLRESLSGTGFSVYHMRGEGEPGSAGNQMHLVAAREDLDRAIIDLVGDLAAYRPGAKVVIFEGSDSEFDLRLVSTLFPDLPKAANLLSAGNRDRVARLHGLLQRAADSGGLSARFYSVVDRDSGDKVGTKAVPRSFKWNVYHIENYLLHPESILAILRDLNLIRAGLSTVDEVTSALRAAAQETLGDLVSHLVRERLNEELVSTLDLRVSAQATNLAHEFARAISSSLERAGKWATVSGTETAISSDESRIRGKLEDALTNGSWLAEFRGRDVLRRFGVRYTNGLQYECLRDLIIAKMRDVGYQPSGMTSVIQQILDDK